MCEKKEFEKHLTQEDIASFHAMTLDTDALIAFAEHIEACPACAAKVAESEQEMDIHVPKGFAPEVRLRAAGGDRQEFYRYSLRVCAAVRFSDAVVYREFFLMTSFRIFLRRSLSF